MPCIRAAVLLLCAAVTAGVPTPSAAQSQADVPRIPYRERTLPNGLRVYSVLDRSTPTVVLSAWYGFGSRDDPPGRSGMAHLIEHLMFQGSRNVKPNQMVEIAEDAGWPNFPGSQSLIDYDALRVFQEVPSGSLERFLWAEADRLRGLVVTDSLFDFERDAVSGEIRRSVLDPPYGGLPVRLQRESFARHPYRNFSSGNIEELGRATLQEVRAFNARFSRPDNVVLVVVGNFDEAQLDRWVDRYFGPIPRPAAPLQRERVEEPARTTERRFTEQTRGRTAAVGISFPTPAWSHPDIAAIRIARQMLASPGSARMTRLVQPQRIASRVAVVLPVRRDPAVLTLEAYGTPGTTAEQLEQAMRAEIARMRDEPVPEADLERIKNLLVTERLRFMETNVDKADVLGQAIVVEGDPQRVNSWIAQLRAVTAADIQRVMRTYAADNNLVILHYLPGPPRAAGQGPTGTERGNR